MPDRRLDSDYPQYERDVESMPVINGSTCLIWIDVTSLGNAFARRMTQDTGVGPTDQQLADAIRDAIVAKLEAECPEGQVKLELQYHFSPKPVDAGGGRTRQWQQQNSVELALRRLAGEAPGERLQKVYLKGCYSDGDLNLVDAAFSLPNVEFVVTVDDVIFLVPPGVICGGDTGFRPQPVGVTIWKKEGDSQIGQKSDDRVDDDERYNIHTGTVENKSDPITGPCPTVTALRGSDRNWVMSGSLAAVDSYIATLQASGVDHLAVGQAGAKAARQANDHDCRNPHCQKKRVTTPVVSNLHFTRVQSPWWLLLFQVHYNAYLNFDWTAEMWCDR